MDYYFFASQMNYDTYRIDILKFHKIIDGYRKYIINIYRKQEYNINKKSIPIYNYLFIKDNSMKELKIQLPPSDYVYVLRDDYNKIIFTGELNLIKN